jgi:hypothetical protein
MQEITLANGGNPRQDVEIFKHHPLDLDQLPSAWRVLAGLFRRYAHEESAAALLESCAGQLEAALRPTNDELLSLRDAAALSGYSVDHLGRLIREGRIPNCGRKGKPLVRSRDLPRRIAAMDADGTQSYDAVADARSLLVRGRARE